jgi:hypothetical protein
LRTWNSRCSRGDERGATGRDPTVDQRGRFLAPARLALPCEEPVDQFGSRGVAGLGQDSADVGFDGAFGQDEPAGYLPVRQGLRYQFDDLALALAERVIGAGSAVGRRWSAPGSRRWPPVVSPVRSPPPHAADPASFTTPPCS